MTAFPYTDKDTLPDGKLTLSDSTSYLPSNSPLSPTRSPRSLTRRIFNVLTPSFLSREPSPPEHQYPTAFLDGLRGYAAFFVFITHCVLPTHPNAYMGYGGNDGVNDGWFFQLPIIRLMHSGLACVHVFFVISGFSISLKALKQMRKSDHEGVFTTLFSSTFRRTARLYLPCFALLFCVLILTLSGAMDFVNAIAKDWPFGDQPEEFPPIKNGFFVQVGDLLYDIWQWADPLNPYSRISYMPYSLQLWTIPVELRCSFITFVCLLGVAKCRPSIRMLSLGALSFYFYFRKHSDPPLFLGGAIIAELYLIQQENLPSKASLADTPNAKWSRASNIDSRGQKIKHGLLFVLGLFLTSYPRHGANKAMFYSWLTQLGTYIAGPQRKALLDLFTCAGALLLVYSVSRSPMLQRFFSTPLAKYLGKTSFALYCVHQPLINWFGYRNILAMWQITGKETTFQYELGFGIAFVIQLAVSVWAADLFWRAVDKPSVTFAKWLEKVCCS